MKNTRQLYLIIFFVLVLGLFVQGARVNLFLSMSNMKNTHVQAYSKVNNYMVPETVKKQTNIQENFLIIYDPKNDYSLALKNNICRLLLYMKKNYQAIDVRQCSNIALGNYGTILIAMNDINSVSDINKLIYYVGDGGHIFFTAYLEDSDNLTKIYRKLGIYELGNCGSVNGLKLLQDVLIRGKGQNFKLYHADNYCRYLGLQQNCCQLYAVSDKNIPLMWSVPYGQGKFMVFNGSTLERKEWRGMLAGGISLLNEDFIYPIFNFKLAFIDDFPTPFPTNTDPKIMKEYHRNLPSFFYEIWWPDILASASQNNIIYNGAVIETYNDQVKPPFKDLKSQNKNNLITYGREILKSGGEMGIHGYNHQPLAEPGYIETLPYNPWSSEEYMMAGIEEALDFAQSAYPNYEFRLYVPPSNIISQRGLQALYKSMPTLKVISSLYTKDADDTETYTQEFEIDKDGIAQIPRISAGYTDRDDILWYEYNSISSLGIFSHFIHPDDVLSEDRGAGWTWEAMYDQYDRILRQIRKFYWLRPMTASQAASEVEKFQNTRFYYIRSATGITCYCEHMTGDMYLLIRTEKKLKGSDCTVSPIDEGIYLVRAEKPKFELLFSR